MIKIVPFINQDVQFEPIIYYGLDFIFNPNSTIKLKPTHPYSQLKQLSDQGLNWFFDLSSAQDNESKALKIWHDVSLAARVSRAFKEGKPIILFDKQLETKGLSQIEADELINDIVREIKKKNTIGVGEDDEKLVIK